MKRKVWRALGWLSSCAAAVLSLGGCPAAGVPLDLPAPGAYWAEYDGDALALFRLPEYRGDPGSWLTVQMDPPEWFTGAGVYRLGEDAAWSRQTEGDDLTLDEVLQLWDAAPVSEPGA